MKRMKSITTIFLTSLLLLFASKASAILVDTELALVIDVSGSVDATDYALQMDGYEAAFNNATVQSNIASLTNGIAVEVIFFSTTAVVAGIEAVLTNEAESSAFATAIGNLVRPFSAGTTIESGMNLGLSWLLNNNYEGSNLIMDVSGDGTSGSAANVQAARDAAANAGVIVNGLAIDDPPFFSGGCLAGGYYTLNVITSGGQCYQATGFSDFERAVIAKIQAETGGGGNVPLPSTLLLLGAGLLGVGATRRFIK